MRIESILGGFFMKFSDFKRLKDFTRQELYKILKKGFELKYKIDVGKYKPFTDKTMTMIFEKPSTRTRVSFEAGMYQLGGQAIYLNANDIQIGRGETIEDTARILSGYASLVMIRTFEHEKVEKLAKYSTVPVINGLSDMYHPCQVLSDIFSIMEAKGLNIEEDNTKNFNKMNFLYIGDGTNVAHSLIDACAIFGMNMYVVCPKGYEPDLELLKNAQKTAQESNCKIVLLNDVKDLDAKIDVVYTDIWISMGKEQEKQKRLNDFQGYQVNSELLKKYCKDDVSVMHCLPAHRGEEITAEVMESQNSIVFEQASNRLHVQKAIMIYCIEGLN
jgi:ornithine carbamoyltransferase